MPTKLSQIVAVTNGKKKRTQAKITEVYHRIQKDTLFSGITREYRPIDDEGVDLPPESRGVQMQVAHAVKQVADAMTDLFDTVATQDYNNCTATAHVVVNGKVILRDVPVTNLLFLDKQLEDIRTFISKLPLLPPEKEWVWSTEHGCFKSKTEETSKTKRVPKAHVLSEATEHHPAQVNEFHEDEIVGWWHTVHLSGAMQAQKRSEMVERVTKLHDAVKFARQKANEMEVTSYKVGKPIFDFICEGATPQPEG